MSSAAWLSCSRCRYSTAWSTAESPASYSASAAWYSVRASLSAPFSASRVCSISMIPALVSPICVSRSLTSTSSCFSWASAATSSVSSVASSSSVLEVVVEQKSFRRS